MPLRFPRPVMPVIAAGMAAAWVVAGSAPAFADQVRQHEWWLNAVNIPQAWAYSRGAGITVAVLSDGVNAAQPGLGGAVTIGPDFTNAASTASFVGVTGTQLASLIAGRGTGRGAGVIGVAPKARILAIRVTLDAADPALDSSAVGAGLPDAIANGIRYAVAHHAKVIDLPTDPGQPSPGQVAALPVPPQQTTAPQLAGLTAAAGGSSAELAAVAYARRKGVLLIAAAGDNGAGTNAANFPAAYPGVIAVGAFDQRFTGAPFSSRQPYVALTGPGADLVAASPVGGATVVSSTNAASAVVSGIAALIRSRYPSLTAAQVRRILTSSAVYRSTGASAPGQGSGTVDAGRALTSAAALLAPRDARAGAGAASFASPAAPGITPVTATGLAPRILRAGIISAALLVLLLLGVLAYHAAGRRRDRKDAAAAAEWARTTRNAFSPYGDQEADRMLEFFAAPASSPARPAVPFPAVPSTGARPGSRDTAASAGAAATASSPPGSALGGSGLGAWAPLGSASRTPSRPVKVSGAPPWEPAAEPSSDLPWAGTGAATPLGAGTAGTRSASTGAAPGSAWPAVTSPPTATAPSAAPSPSGRPWEDLPATSITLPDTQSSTTAGPSPRVDVPAPPDDDGFGGPGLGGAVSAGRGLGSDRRGDSGLAGGPGAGFDRGAPGDTGLGGWSSSPFGGPGSGRPAHGAGAPGPSPSGSNWEGPEGLPDDAPDSGSALWTPAAGQDPWLGARPSGAWPTAAPGSGSGNASGYDSGLGQTAGTSSDASTGLANTSAAASGTSHGTDSDGGAAGPAGAPAPRPWSTDGTSGIFRWAPTPSRAESARWTPDPDPATQPSAEPLPEPFSPDSSVPPPASDSSWSTPDTRSSWATPDTGSSWSTPDTGSSWATPDTDWNSPGSGPGWESAGTRARQHSVNAPGPGAISPAGQAVAPSASGAPGEPGNQGGEPADGDTGQLYAWRPSAQTETFPVIDEG